MIALDLKILFWLNGLSSSSAVWGALAVFCAEYLPYFLGLGFCIFLLRGTSPAAKRRRLFWAALAGTVVSEGVILQTFHFFYHRLRPFAAYGAKELVPAFGYSFPSGHSIFFFTLSTVAYRSDWRLGLALYVGSFLVIAGRVAAGVHFPSDVFAGALLGVCVGYWVSRFFDARGARKAPPSLSETEAFKA